MGRLRERYAQGAVVLLNALLLFALLNVAAWAWGAARRRQAALGALVARHGLDHVAKAYPEMSRADLVAFLRESHRAKLWEYEPFTEFRQLTVTGRFVNVDPAGFRRIGEQAPWPPRPGAAAVFVFGGSTTLGVGLPDDATIPSHLQGLLRAGGRRVDVYSFARASYFSTQERILFEQLLSTGVAPAAAVFVDGLNDTINLDGGLPPHRWRSARSAALKTLVEESGRSGVGPRLSALARELPLVAAIRHRLSELPAVREERLQAGVAARRAETGALVERWIRNVAMIRAVGARFGVTTLHVWQPIPGYRDEPAARLFPERQEEVLAPSVAVFDALEARLRDAPDPDVLWLAGMATGRRENLYVDDVHYTSRFSKEIAAEVARALEARGVGGP